MAATRYLTALELQRMHEDLLEDAGRAAPLLDVGKLESASLRPQNVAYYEHADIYLLAASLMGGIALAHAFEDGNKRLALVAGATFLLLNGIRIIADAVSFGEQILALVNREDTLEAEQQRLAEWLQAHSVPVSYTDEWQLPPQNEVRPRQQ